MLVPDSELPGGERAKVLDFGVAKVTQTVGNMTQAGSFLGTPAYMSPEQCMDAGNVNEKTDVYALGVIFYEMLTGAPPFTATGVGEMVLRHVSTPPRPVRELVPELPEHLAGLIMRMLAKTAAERPSARDLVRALEAAASGQFSAASGAYPAASGAYPAASGAYPAASGAYPAASGAYPAASGAYPAASGAYPAASGQFAPVLSGPGSPTLAAPVPIAPISAPIAVTPPPVATPFSISVLDGRGAAFVHRSAAAMTIDNYTFIEHPLANHDPSALVFITPNWNPGGQGGAYNNHHTGVWWASNARWSIYNEDRIVLPTNTAFNVLVSKTGFVHRAVAGNIVNNWTLIDHPDCNNRKDALLIITANWNPGGYGGTYNNHAIGVWYTNGRWSIYNQDRQPLPANTAWNVLVSERTFCHRVTPANLLGGNGTFIEHPAARGNPDAVILVTANWNPGGVGGLYNDHAIGVHYYGDRWAIFNQDMAPMPPGAAFNVWIA